MWERYLESCYTSGCKNSTYLVSIIDDSVITCDEIIGVEEAKTLQQILMKKRNLWNAKFQYLTSLFINYYCNY